jgi:trk system potassium uptake protein TrkH
MRGVYKRIHPQSVKPIMVQGKPVTAQNASSITVFLLLYFALFIFSALVVSLENQDMETTLSAVVAAFTNNGTCFGKMTGSYFGIFSWFGEFYLSILMLAGRLEMYAVIVLFSRSFWNSDRARS